MTTNTPPEGALRPHTHPGSNHFSFDLKPDEWLIYGEDAWDLDPDAWESQALRVYGDDGQGWLTPDRWSDFALVVVRRKKPVEVEVTVTARPGDRVAVIPGDMWEWYVNGDTPVKPLGNRWHKAIVEAVEVES